MIKVFICAERKSSADTEYRVQHPINVNPISSYS
jgi:hypothetical protein